MRLALNSRHTANGAPTYRALIEALRDTQFDLRRVLGAYRMDTDLRGELSARAAKIASLVQRDDGRY